MGRPFYTREQWRESYEARISPEPNTGCWLWTGKTKPNGYGDANTPGSKSASAHRVIYEFFRGPVPRDLVVDHLCRTPACVNPDHLEPVPQRTNLMRGETLARANAEKTHCKRGHEFTPENTQIDKKRGLRSCKECMGERVRAWQRTDKGKAALARAAAKRAPASPRKPPMTPDEVKARNREKAREHYWRNRDKIVTKMRARYDADPEAQRAYQKAWRAKKRGE